jgi:hypothetical protein
MYTRWYGDKLWTLMLDEGRRQRLYACRFEGANLLELRHGALPLLGSNGSNRTGGTSPTMATVVRGGGLSLRLDG